MFEKGEYVVCGNKGVCLVEDITTLNISGVDRERKYYILKPVYVAASTVYVPVDAAKESMRRILNSREAKELIQVIPDIPLINISNDKLLEQEYRGCIRSNDCQEWVRIIKTIYLRRQKRIEAGRKVTAVDAKYFRLAEDNLYGELAISLNMPREEVEHYIAEEIG
ncbi:MAG: CarD family transcriptional regulator [Lachnospiraceae bacterium]|nr:CarD family transcriptional regulator [Lachnospiraceae bacterium]